MGALVGLEAKMYRLSTGSRAAWPASGAPSSLDVVANIRDLSLGLSTAEADVTTRGGNGWRSTVQTLKEGTITFEMVWDTADTDFQAFQTAWANRTSIACAILDQDKATVGATGLWADFAVTGFEKTENLEDAQKVTVTMKPTYSAVPPEWVEVGA